MSITSYRVRLLTIDDFKVVFDIPFIIKVIRAWRSKFSFESKCPKCEKILNYRYNNFELCCQSLYLNPTKNYLVKSLAIHTPNIHILPIYLKTKLLQNAHVINQSFLVLPDVLYWQLETTLVYEPALNFLHNPFRMPIETTYKKTGTSTKRKNGSYYNHVPQLDIKLSKTYDRIQHAPLYHRNLSNRTQGKDALIRKIGIPKRTEGMSRAMIIPDPTLKANEAVVPESMAELVGQLIIVNRMPSLSPQNFVVLKVVRTWKKNCIGLPDFILKGLNADFDGDQVAAIKTITASAQAECLHILDSRHNMKSFANYLKLYPTQDTLVAYYLYPPSLTTLPLFDFLRLVYELEGSNSCFEWFDIFRQHYLNVLENEVSFSICFAEFEYLKSVVESTSSVEEFIWSMQNVPHEEMCLEVQVKSGAKGSYLHLYQLVSFLDGLTPEQYIAHAKDGHFGFIESSIGVWKPGYNYFKLVNNMQNLIVDYKGQLVDGDAVLCCDVMEYMYYEDVMSYQTFDFLFDYHFG